LLFHPSSIISLTSLLKTRHISLASVSEFKQVPALRLDTVSPNINGLSGDYLMELGQFDKALGQYRKTVELDPQQYNSRVRLGFAYAVVHRYAEAERELKKNGYGGGGFQHLAVRSPAIVQQVALLL
jgi:tetratricopeptide (TPR) repeat protein